MGEIADSIIDGEFDYITGEYIGPGVGYPRTRHGNNPKKKKKKSVPLNPESYKAQVLKLLFADTNQKGFNLHEVVRDYCVEELKMQKNISEKVACKYVLLDPTKFKAWFIEKYTPKNGIQS